MDLIEKCLPQQGELAVRRMQGILSFAKKYGIARVDDDCAAALEMEAKVFHEYPGERAAKHYETALLLTEGLRQSGLQLMSRSRDADRERIRNWLSTQNNLYHALQGLTGRLL